MAFNAADPLLAHLRAALGEAGGALRCYLALLAGEGEARARGLLGKAIFGLMLAGAAITGLAIAASGLTDLIGSRFELPGIGAIIVGGGVLVAAAVGGLIWRGSGRK